MHPAGEFFGRGQGVGQAAIAIGQFFEVHENGTSNMPAFIFGGSTPTRIGHKPGGIDNPQIRRALFFRQPFGGYQ